jgi:hypothetical protein
MLNQLILHLVLVIHLPRGESSCSPCTSHLPFQWIAKVIIFRPRSNTWETIVIGNNIIFISIYTIIHIYGQMIYIYICLYLQLHIYIYILLGNYSRYLTSASTDASNMHLTSHSHAAGMPLTCYVWICHHKTRVKRYIPWCIHLCELRLGHRSWSPVKTRCVRRCLLFGNGNLQLG